jgi:hypothetical protein
MTAVPASDRVYAHVNIWRLSDARTAEWEAVAITIFDSEADRERGLGSVKPLVEERVRALTVGEPERRQGVVPYATGPEPAAARAAVAEEGGIGIIDRGFRPGEIEAQVREVQTVKRTQHAVIGDPYRSSPRPRCRRRRS